ncbi:MAG: protein phosphatase 2C domain-containing protein [Oscillospiraceae bacterium]|jgi:serine/threonine protein phosphatase PrpC|nr:protein phosphatase 2C domain-containing protein [Oscillospiraceae bacterium]
MIFSYGVSLPGTYHIKNDIVCQDSHAIAEINKNSAIVAVADGLGSAQYSDVGSKIAVSVAVEYCKQHIHSAKTEENILRIINTSFHIAQRAIEAEANEKDRPVELYDTTLSLAILVKDVLFYGHSGDSGIIALTTEGKYEQVTTQQRDEQGCVYPLFFTEFWVFARFSKKVSAIILATDGMLETFFPIYIKNECDNIHVSLAQYFMDIDKLQIKKLGKEAVRSKIEDYLQNIPDEQVNDDKTVVVVINTSVKTKKQPPEYYVEPDWVELKRKHDEAWKREAYPGLYKDTTSVTSSESALIFKPELNDESSYVNQNNGIGKHHALNQKNNSTANFITRALRSICKFKRSRLFLLLLLIITIGLTSFLMIYVIVTCFFAVSEPDSDPAPPPPIESCPSTR